MTSAGPSYGGLYLPSRIAIRQATKPHGGAMTLARAEGGTPGTLVLLLA